MPKENSDREFVRTFFTSPTAVEGDDTAKMLRKAAQLRGMQAPDVWVPDNEDATAPSMRDEGIENILDVISEHGEAFPSEIHPRIVWHRDEPETRQQGFEQMMRLADPDAGAIAHIDGFVVPEVGSIDDWKKADEFITLVESDNNLEEGGLSLSPIIESAEAELAMSRLDREIGKSSNNLERLYLLVDGEVDYTKDMRAMTPTGDLPAWPELRHNTSRAASANGLIAIDGPYDDIRDVEGYHQRMTDNRAKGMTGIWSLTPGQVVEANTAPLPPREGTFLLEVDDEIVELKRTEDGTHVHKGNDIKLEEQTDGSYRFTVGQKERDLEDDELREELRDRIQYVMALDDYVDSMAKFEEAKAAGKGAISMTRSVRLVLDGTEIEVTQDRMWDEATYQAAQTPLAVFQEVYKTRLDQQDKLKERYGEGVVDRALKIG